MMLRAALVVLGAHALTVRDEPYSKGATFTVYPGVLSDEYLTYDYSIYSGNTDNNLQECEANAGQQTVCHAPWGDRVKIMLTVDQKKSIPKSSTVNVDLHGAFFDWNMNLLTKLSAESGTEMTSAFHQTNISSTQNSPQNSKPKRPKPPQRRGEPTRRNSKDKKNSKGLKRPTRKDKGERPLKNWFNPERIAPEKKKLEVDFRMKCDVCYEKNKDVEFCSELLPSVGAGKEWLPSAVDLSNKANFGDLAQYVKTFPTLLGFPENTAFLRGEHSAIKKTTGGLEIKKPECTNKGPGGVGVFRPMADLGQVSKTDTRAGADISATFGRTGAVSWHWGAVGKSRNSLDNKDWNGGGEFDRAEVSFTLPKEFPLQAEFWVYVEVVSNVADDVIIGNMVDKTVSKFVMKVELNQPFNHGAAKTHDLSKLGEDKRVI